MKKVNDTIYMELDVFLQRLQEEFLHVEGGTLWLQVHGHYSDGLFRAEGDAYYQKEAFGETWVIRYRCYRTSIVSLVAWKEVMENLREVAARATSHKLHVSTSLHPEAVAAFAKCDPKPCVVVKVPRGAMAAEKPTGD